MIEPTRPITPKPMIATDSANVAGPAIPLAAICTQPIKRNNAKKKLRPCFIAGSLRFRVIVVAGWESVNKGHNSTAHKKAPPVA